MPDTTLAPPPAIDAPAAAPAAAPVSEPAEAPAWMRDEAERREPRPLSTAIRASKTPHLARSLTVFLVLFAIATVLALAFVPWRQVVAGSGGVTSFDPAARPQTVEALIDGRVARWGVQEGERVEAGEVIAELEDISSSFLDRDFVARQQQIRDAQIQAATLGVQSARQATAQAEQSVLSARAALSNAEIELETARTRNARAEALAAEGLAATRDLESARLALQKAQRDRISAAASLESAERSLDARRIAEEEAQQKVAVATADYDLDLGNARGRAENAVVRAPVAGTVVRIAQVGSGQTVKAGDELATVVPDTRDQAVELYVSDMDAALVEPGREVRLQFAGYPALMFSGAPGLSVGVFGGRVAVVDAVDDGTGRFRLLVVPDSASAWPDRTFLRQGSSATGWVLLGEVPLGYELWRRMNGLPPQIPVRGATPKDDGGYDEKPKDAKPPAGRLK